jgi:hypothetical protein
MSRSPNGRYGQGVAVDVAIVGQDVQRRRGVLVGGEAVVRGHRRMVDDIGCRIEVAPDFGNIFTVDRQDLGFRVIADAFACFRSEGVKVDNIAVAPCAGEIVDGVKPEIGGGERKGIGARTTDQLVLAAPVDLALLRSALIPTEFATFTAGASWGSGGNIAAIGHPNQGLPTLSPVVTLGTLSGKKILALGFEVAVVKADIRKGDSGGPLLDARTGAVLGVVFAKIDTPGVYAKTGDLVRNEGYAIPADVVLAFLRANGVGYRLLDPAKKSKPGNLVDRAKAYVARIECWK